MSKIFLALFICLLPAVFQAQTDKKTEASPTAAAQEKQRVSAVGSAELEEAGKLNASVLQLYEGGA